MRSTDREWSRKAKATNAQKPYANSMPAEHGRVERLAAMRLKSFKQAGAFDLDNQDDEAPTPRESG